MAIAAAQLMVMVGAQRGLTQAENCLQGWGRAAKKTGKTSLGKRAQLLGALQDEGAAETSAEDNLKTVRLVFAAYEAARRNRVVTLNEAG